VAITQHTKDADEKLRKELEKADVGKFKQALRNAMKGKASPAHATKKKK